MPTKNLCCLYCNKGLNDIFKNKNEKWFKNHINISFNIICNKCNILYSFKFPNMKYVILNIIEYMVTIKLNKDLSENNSNILFNTLSNGESECFINNKIIKLPNWFLITDFNTLKQKCGSIVNYRLFI
jgi:RNA processing factor Prp31